MQFNATEVSGSEQGVAICCHPGAGCLGNTWTQDDEDPAAAGSYNLTFWRDLLGFKFMSSAP